MLIAAPGLLLIAAASAAPQPGTRTVTEAAAGIAALDGQAVRVRGWTSGCHGGFDCTRGSTREAKDHVSALTIALDDRLEAELARRDGLPIVLEARVTAACRSSDRTCLDRGPDLIPIKLIETPGADAPGRH